MKFKRLLSTLSIMMLTISYSMSTTNVIHADDATQTIPQLTVAPNNNGNCIDLSWTMADKSQNYSYMIYSKKSIDTEFQSIPAKKIVKVLNVYPDVGNNLKTWMETNGYGRGLINVDEVSIDNFNANPVSYLKDANGNWKYDVVYMGAWNANNFKDISVNAEELMEEFIKSGRGYLGGHDTMWMQLGNLEKLKKFMNIKTALYTDMTNSPNFLNGPFNDYQKNAITDFNVYSPHIGGSQISILKKGLLTDYPWNIGNIGTTLDVPYSHTTAQFVYGDVWMNYIHYDGYETASPEGKGTNNFYLTTWNNTALIMTGHSNGAATPDEQKVLANTLFYLAQVTNDTSWEDHKGQDVDAPNKPVIKSVKNDVTNNKISIGCEPAVDNGSTYDYYVEAKGLTDGTKRDSATKEATITSGIKGYSIVVDKKPGTIPTNTITTTSPDYTLDKSYSSDFYVHVAAIDNAGNISEVTHQKVHVRYANAIVINKGADELEVGETDKLTALVTPSDSLVKTVKWTSSDPSIVTVDDNGNITAVKAGMATITATVQDGRNLHGQCRVYVTD